MQVMDDMALLREYATRNSEAAFEALVLRRVNFVYSAALRQVRDPHLAEEITQAVFIILAQKAGRISDKTILTGWLFRTTRFTAIALTRSAAKRQHREQEAYVQSEIQQSASDEIWEQMSPTLDEALARLGEKDRQAVLLRYFENKSLAEVGTSLGTGEDTARKRISRALEKLRGYYSRRGVVSTTSILAGAISANSVQAAPVALAKSVTAVAVAKGAAVGGSTLTLIEGALKIMAWTKMKTAAVTGAVILLAAGTTTVVVKTVQAGRTASPPDIQGAWEGVEEIRSTAGVQQGEQAKSRVVFKFFKTNGTYSATGEFIDTAPEPFQATSFTYDYPSVRFDAGQNLSYQGKLKARATEISGTFRMRNFSVPMLLKRTATPPAAPVPLARNDYTPRAGSDLQGTWKAALGSVRVTVKIAEPSPGTFRAELDNLTSSWLGQPLVVTYNPPEVKLLVASGAGMFQGEVRSGNTEMVGNWVQGGRQTPVTFKRADH
jgi:RNA polymerase sigma factor (sigma-70 family)